MSNTTTIHSDSTIEIHLLHGYSTVIDVTDSDLTEVNWFPHGRAPFIYACRSVKHPAKKNRQKTLGIHVVILERMIGRKLVKPERCDHIDGNGLNNRRSNLRVATGIENCRNQGMRSDNKSGYRGVIWDKKSKKWRAYITVGGKKEYLGLFTDINDAVQVRQDAEKEKFGEFSPLICRKG